MKSYQNFLILFLALISSTTIKAQNCSCTIAQIENNTVTPCNITIGTVVTVSSVNAFKNAISQANNSGGNMTILITDGTYQVASADSYPYLTASNVVIRSQSGNRDAVILTGGGMRDINNETENGIGLQGNNVTIADLTIKEVANHAISVNGDNLYVHNVKIENTFQQMLKGTGAGDGADNGRVQCSLFEYTAGVGPQFYIGGIDVHKGNNWQVSDNIFKNIASPSVTNAEHAIHFWRASGNNTIERNIITACDRGIGFGLGNDVNNGNTGGIIRNNIIYNNGSGLFDDVGIGLEYSPDTKVYNNTINVVYQNAIEYRFSATTNVAIANNLTNKSISTRDGAQASLQKNFTNAQSSWFVNLSSGDLRLNSDYSELVNQGIYLSEVEEDIDQTPRPQGNSFDIGAYEYSNNNEPEPPIGELPLFQISQLTYDGAFRLPSGSDDNDVAELNYSEGPIAYNADNHSLFIVGHAHNQAITEYAIPELVISNQITDLNMSSNQLQNFKQVLDFTPDGNPETLDRIGGMYYYNETTPPKLLVNAYHYYDAGGTRTLTTLMVNNALNLAQSAISGYYQFEGGAGHTNGWMSPIPTEWQAELNGKMITGNSSGEPIISRWSVGPSAFSFDAQDFTTSGNSTISTTQLLDFSLSNPLNEDLCNASLNNDLWTFESRATYGFIVPNTRTYFTIGFSGGHNSGICYKTISDNSNNECGACSNESGCPGFCTNDADDNYCYYWLWDVNDLLKVKNGTIAAHEVLPYDYGNFDVPFEPEIKQIGGGSFDVNSGQLYLSLQKADTEQGTYRNPPLILVYNTNQISATQIQVDANYIEVQSTQNKNVYEIKGNTNYCTYQILDASLQVYESINSSPSPMYINTNHLPDGLYYISIKNNANDKISLRKIIKTE